jgi:hypothetical protein
MVETAAKCDRPEFGIEAEARLEVVYWERS